MKTETKSYVESVGSKENNKTIQLIPPYIHDFLNDNKKKFDKTYLWELLSMYLTEDFYIEFEKYLDYRGIKLNMGENGENECDNKDNQEEAERG